MGAGHEYSVVSSSRLQIEVALPVKEEDGRKAAASTSYCWVKTRVIATIVGRDIMVIICSLIQLLKMVINPFQLDMTNTCRPDMN